MSIKYALLGLLSWKSSTGYELKKILEESSFMYWSGNNNQIYKTLVDLLDDGLVTSETQHQEGSPSKKIYTITDKGIVNLRKWVLSSPEPPDIKKTFLIQLAWADQLDNEELNDLLSKYESEIKMQLLMQHEKLKRGNDSPKRSPRELYLWDMIFENIISSYKNELDWIKKVRNELFEREVIEERSKMNYKVVENGTKKYVEFISSSVPLSTEQDALDLVELCGENDTNLLMIHSNALSEDFFMLKTGVAGKMLQKLINYHIQAAAIITKQQMINTGKFKEMVSEANKGYHFRVFETRSDAEVWLLSI